MSQHETEECRTDSTFTFNTAHELLAQPLLACIVANLHMVQRQVGLARTAATIPAGPASEDLVQVAQAG